VSKMSNKQERIHDKDFKKASACVIGACLEVARKKERVVIRLSQDKTQKLSCTTKEFDAFIDGVKNGEFD